jgi:hypothetical protein
MSNNLKPAATQIRAPNGARPEGLGIVLLGNLVVGPAVSARCAISFRKDLRQLRVLRATQLRTPHGGPAQGVRRKTVDRQGNSDFPTDPGQLFRDCSAFSVFFKHATRNTHQINIGQKCLELFFHFHFPSFLENAQFANH